MPQISIIMPVYNSVKFLSKAIESVTNQTLKDIELILINDGSTDGSEKICDLYAKTDSRIIVIHQKNKGICAARNAGLSVAKGEYIAFADSDDEFMEGLLLDNFKIAKKTNADIVKFGIKYIDIDGQGNQKEIKGYELNDYEFDKNGLVLNYPQLRETNMFMFVWNSLFKKELIVTNNLVFDSRIKFGGEDCSFNYDCLIHTKKLVVSKRIYYKHFRRFNHSTVLKYDFNKAESAVIMAEKEQNWFNSAQLYKKNPGYWEKLLAKYLTSIIVITFDKRYRKSLGEKIKFLESVKKLKQFEAVFNKNSSLLKSARINRFELFTNLLAKKKYKTLFTLVKIYSFINK